MKNEIDRIKHTSGDPLVGTGEPINLCNAHKLWMELSTDPNCQDTSSSQGCAPIDPQGWGDPIDLMFIRQYKALTHLYHPTIAAVLAHQNVTHNPYHVMPIEPPERAA